jgi:hypothetical protein
MHDKKNRKGKTTLLDETSTNEDIGLLKGI